MGKNFYVVKVVWSSEDNHNPTITQVLYANTTYKDIVEEVVTDFGENEILSMEITPCYGGFGNGLWISESLANALINFDGEWINVKASLKV